HPDELAKTGCGLETSVARVNQTLIAGMRPSNGWPLSRSVDHRTENGELYGRPNGTPAVTVCTGFRYALPSRRLLRVSTNDTGPSINSMIATSPGAPTCSVPSFGMRLITLAGAVVAIVMTCSSEKPSPMNLLITQVRYGMPGEL